MPEAAREPQHKTLFCQGYGYAGGIPGAGPASLMAPSCDHGGLKAFEGNKRISLSKGLIQFSLRSMERLMPS